MSDELTIKDIIKAAGGPAGIQAELERHGQPLTKDAIYKWPKTGVPDRYWPVLINLTTYGPADLYEANCRARSVTFRIPEAAE